MKTVMTAALALCLVPSVCADQEAVYTAARTSIVAERLADTSAIGFNAHQVTFREVPRLGTLLVGFDLGLGKFLNDEVIYALRPIYRTPDGDFSGQAIGLFPGSDPKSKAERSVRLRAPEGYAVGGVTLRTGLNIDGLSITYMQVHNETLNPNQQYSSSWVGKPADGQEKSIDGQGAPIVGIFGNRDDARIMALGLVYLKDYIPEPASLPAAVPEVRPNRQRPANRGSDDGSAGDSNEPSTSAEEPEAAANPNEPAAESEKPDMAMSIGVFVGVAGLVFIALMVVRKKKDPYVPDEHPEPPARSERHPDGETPEQSYDDLARRFAAGGPPPERARAQRREPRDESDPDALMQEASLDEMRAIARGEHPTAAPTDVAAESAEADDPWGIAQGGSLAEMKRRARENRRDG